MSLSSIATSAITKVEQVSKTDLNSDGKIGGVSYSVGTTAAGGYMAQGGGAPGEAAGGSLVKKMLVGGVVGAGVGFAATFTPVLGLVTSLGPAGWAAKGILTAAGAAIGAIGGAVMHLIGKRKQNLAMQAQAQAAQQGAMAPTPSPQGVTLRDGARGPAAKKLQSDLAALGMYKGKLNGAFDKATADAVRRYEVMKGVVPTGLGSADVRAAVSQDVSLLRQYAT